MLFVRFLGMLVLLMVLYGAIGPYTAGLVGFTWIGAELRFLEEGDRN